MNHSDLELRISLQIVSEISIFLFIEISKKCQNLQDIVVASVVKKLSIVNGQIMSRFLFPLLLHELSTNETKIDLFYVYENKVL